MQIWHNITDDVKRYAKPVVAIGVFDGLHLGHQALIKTAMNLAQKTNKSLIVITFNPHPGLVLYPDSTLKLLTTLDTKSKILAEDSLAQLSNSGLLVLDFSSDFASLSAEQFVSDILIKGLDISAAVVGENFNYGHKGKGTAETLIQAGDKYGFTVVIEPLLKIVSASAESTISSSAIRNLLQEGKVDTASVYLGRNFFISGEVIPGDKQGRKLGFPTANILPPADLCLPKEGIYAGKITLFSNSKPEKHDCAISVGTRPTFNGSELLVESYIFNFDRYIYGEMIKVEFLDFIRPQQFFSDIDDLVTQMQQDIIKIKQILE